MRDTTPSLSRILGSLHAHLSRRRRVQVLALILLMLAGIVAELATFGAIIPLLTLLANPQKALDYPLLQQLFNLFGWRNENILLPATALFGVTAVLAACVRMLLIWAGNKTSYGIGYDLGVEVYRRTLLQPYRYHVARNTSQIIAGMGKVQSVVSGLLMPLLNTLIAILMTSAIFVALVLIDPLVACAAGVLFSLLYLLISLGTRRKLRQNGRIIAQAHNVRVQAIQEGLGGIRDILIDGTQELYVKRFRKVDADLRKAQVVNSFLGTAPRYLIEAIGMLSIAVLAYTLSHREGGLSAALPVLGALAIGAQRLLPQMQQIYHGWSTIMGNRGNIEDVLELLEQPIPPEYRNLLPARPMAFERSIELRDIGFRYASDGPEVLHHLNLEIAKGSRVGFVGKTGSGKSTTLDLLMGLLEPVGGDILIDGVALTPANRRDWQAHIAHVPQSIYLADASIAENIAFGVERRHLDRERLREAARKAHIAEFIEGLAEQYDTRIGERGVRLSGGQRQRIGIARALYKRADVLIFDEATSALDSVTESAVMEAIRDLGPELTVLIIAHRTSTLSDCDCIYELAGGRLLHGASHPRVRRAPPAPQAEPAATGKTHSMQGERSP
ncbi:ABC transporter ATP-binding protein [Azotobacter vinelandii]